MKGSLELKVVEVKDHLPELYLSSNANPANIEDFNGILVSLSKLTNHLRFVHLQAETN